MEAGGGGAGDAWSEEVEDLVDSGDVAGAISLLESAVSRLQPGDRPPSPSGDLRLATALEDLADLQSSRGLSLKADELRSRALAIRARCSRAPPAPSSGDSESVKDKVPLHEETRVSTPSCEPADEEDDWEAIADRGFDDRSFLSSNNGDEGVSSHSGEEPEVVVTPKRRGRGSFLYEKSCLYSEQLDSATASDDHSKSELASIDDRSCSVEDETSLVRYSGYGTSHVLVLYDFSPSIRTTDLEKFFEKFKDGGVAIRWVNDTTALAVFRTPALARDSQNKIHFPFKIRSLQEDDSLLNQVSTKDLEPPHSRPKTSARTAQRLIAQVMGIKPSTEFGSNDLRKQEEARKSRIVARKSLRDDAWGSDYP
ncbi:R3H and coiled-coil domain-containing protein 1 [Canna indica]|uniref:R3H and coiled-coil domain-containing protein 1 n=1 Tax=Canna indica TaxID=4628 RepID=A0AAQ3K716_9LILI|nr:R3H and coiled-coil domain-containing protein 1 [Canna indica]